MSAKKIFGSSAELVGKNEERLMPKELRQGIFGIP